MARHTIVVVDSIFPDLARFREEAKKVDADVIDAMCTSAEQVPDIVKDADAVMCFHVPVRRDAIEGLTRCKVLVRMGVGYDAIDVDAATEKGIPVVNVPDYCLDEVSDHAVALLLALGRGIHHYDSDIRSGTFSPFSARPVYSMRGRSLGIAGLGKIGRRTARKAAALGMTVRAYDPYLADDIFEAFGVERVEQLPELLDQSEFVSLHTPLTKETAGFIGEKEMRAIPKGGYLVNTSRGGVLDLHALCAIMEEGHLGGAAIDVPDPEPLPDDHPIRSAPNVILTPHAAWFSEASFPRLEASAPRPPSPGWKRARSPRSSGPSPGRDPETWSTVRISPAGTFNAGPKQRLPNKPGHSQAADASPVAAPILNAVAIPSSAKSTSKRFRSFTTSPLIKDIPDRESLTSSVNALFSASHSSYEGGLADACLIPGSESARKASISWSLTW
jgi:D-3-phosphoglycerate dehydrogenase